MAVERKRKLTRTMVLIAVATLPSACGSPSPSAHAEEEPGVPLVGLFDDGFLYGIAADGRVFSGEDLRTPEPTLDGARSIAGSPDGFTILGSPPDDYECAALPDGDVDCRGSDVNGDLDPVPTRACDNPNNACAPGASVA
ncbi:MAG: hypothetical protein ACREJX_21945, partial [Polyangiaceae bacterium]